MLYKALPGFAFPSLLILLLGCSGGSGADLEAGPDGGSDADGGASESDAALPPPDCSGVPVPTGVREGNIGRSGATIVQHEFNTQPTIDLVQFEFDHSGNWSNGTSSIPEGALESSATNPVALVMGLDFDTNTSNFARTFIGFGSFQVHANVSPVVQGPFNPAEIGFFEASAVNVTLREFAYDGNGELQEVVGGCQIPVSSLRINTAYFF